MTKLNQPTLNLKTLEERSFSCQYSTCWVFARFSTLKASVTLQLTGNTANTFSIPASEYYACDVVASAIVDELHKLFTGSHDLPEFKGSRLPIADMLYMPVDYQQATLGMIKRFMASIKADYVEQHLMQDAIRG